MRKVQKAPTRECASAEMSAPYRYSPSSQSGRVSAWNDVGAVSSEDEWNFSAFANFGVHPGPLGNFAQAFCLDCFRAGVRHLCFNKPPKGFGCRRKFENLCTGTSQ